MLTPFLKGYAVDYIISFLPLPWMRSRCSICNTSYSLALPMSTFATSSQLLPPTGLLPENRHFQKAPLIAPAPSSSPFPASRGRPGSFQPAGPGSGVFPAVPRMQTTAGMICAPNVRRPAWLGRPGGRFCSNCGRWR